MENQKPVQNAPTEVDSRRGRRHYRSGISGIGGGLLLVLLGVLLFLATQDILSWDKWWQYLIVGVGVIFLADALIYRRGGVSEFRIGRLIAGIILVGVGIAFLLGSVAWWPLVIIFIGVAVIIGGLLRRGGDRAG
jgi:hypothetical protein